MPHLSALASFRMAALLRCPLLSSASSPKSYPAAYSSMSSELFRSGSWSRSVFASATTVPAVSAALRGASASYTPSVSAVLASSSLASSVVFTLPTSPDVLSTRLLQFSSGSAPALRAATMGTRASTAMGAPTAKSVHEFTVKDINGEDVDLSKFKGKVLLIVNVASACGFTSSNYTELAQVYSHLKDSGLEILAFPCNQFGGQEPGTNAQIKEFACSRYKAEYPIFDKIDVNGPNTAPLYQFLKASKGGGILGDSIKWNFAKFLVDQDGVVVNRYGSTTSPSKIEGDIKKLLGV